jgi:hypothetical protein
VWDKVRAAARFPRACEAVPAPSGRASDADAGRPRRAALPPARAAAVALLANAPVGTDGYGHLWHHLDQRVGVPVSMLDAQSLDEYDLRRFNVLVLPPASGANDLLKAHKDELASWIEGGGTLIACGSSRRR